jgi:hypothetical protein
MAAVTGDCMFFLDFFSKEKIIGNCFPQGGNRSPLFRVLVYVEISVIRVDCDLTLLFSFEIK